MKRPARPVSGQPIPADFFGELWDWINSLTPRGDSNILIDRMPNGTLFRLAKNADGMNLPGRPEPSSLPPSSLPASSGAPVPSSLPGSSEIPPSSPWPSSLPPSSLPPSSEEPYISNKWYVIAADMETRDNIGRITTEYNYYWYQAASGLMIEMGKQWVPSPGGNYDTRWANVRNLAHRAFDDYASAQQWADEHREPKP